MRTSTISIKELQNELAKAFPHTTPLSELDAAILSQPQTTTRVCFVKKFKGLELVIQTYTTDKNPESDEANYHRIVEIAGMNKAFFF